MKQTTIKLDEKDWEKLKSICKANGYKIGFYIEKIIKDYLKEVNDHVRTIHRANENKRTS